MSPDLEIYFRYCLLIGGLLRATSICAGPNEHPQKDFGTFSFWFGLHQGSPPTTSHFGVLEGACLARGLFRKGVVRFSESVKCRFSKFRFSVLNLKFDFISDGGRTREKQIQKALGSLPPCGNRCRFGESAICSSRVHPPSEIKSNFKFKTLRWRPLRWRLTLSDCSFFALETTDPRDEILKTTPFFLIEWYFWEGSVRIVGT